MLSPVVGCFQRDHRNQPAVNPSRTLAGTTPYTDIPANLMFFDRSGPTGDIWYYQIPPPEGRKKYSKTKPMEFAEFDPCLAWWSERDENAHAWKVGADDVLTYDAEGKQVSANLDVKNPNSLEALEHRPPEELISAMLEKEKQVVAIMTEIASELSDGRA